MTFEEWMDDYNPEWRDVIEGYGRAEMRTAWDKSAEIHTRAERERCAGIAEAAANKNDTEARDYSPFGTIHHEWKNRARALKAIAAAIREE